MSPLDERDFITLNAYLDDELSAEERSAFEKRLAAEPALRQELDALATTINVLKLAEHVRAPRNFTLDPAVYGKPAARSFMERLGLIGLPQLVAAGGTLVATLICAAAIILATRGAPTAAGVTAAEAPMADEAANAAQAESAEITMDSAEEAEPTEAAEEEETEAPEEEAEESITSLAAPTFEALGSPEPDLDGGAHGGGGQGGAGGTGPVIGGGEPVVPSPTANTEFQPNPSGGESDNQRNAGTEVSEPPSQDDGAEEGEAQDTSAYSVPTDGADQEEETPKTPPVPIIPIAIVVLVLALGSGVLIARLARRR